MALYAYKFIATIVKDSQRNFSQMGAQFTKIMKISLRHIIASYMEYNNYVANTYRSIKNNKSTGPVQSVE